jgi:prepilin-type N-terminal cleavage/methylation domain-containing protein
MVRTDRTTTLATGQTVDSSPISTVDDMAYDCAPSSQESHAPPEGRTDSCSRGWCASAAVRKDVVRRGASLTFFRRKTEFANSIAGAGVRTAHGFTLIEVTLVLVILVVIGALTVPQMTGAYNRSQLRSSGEVIRSAWARTRLQAMETGQAHMFRCQLKGGEFQLLSIPELMASGAQATNPTGAIIEATGDWRLDFTRLGAGITFAKLDAAPSQQVAAMFSGLQNTAWAGPVVFYPDGTSTDATVLLMNENQNTVRVTLRGMTGTIVVGEVGKEAL